MARYAMIVEGEVYRIKELTDEQAAGIPAHKAKNIIPYITVSRPAFDSATHHAPVKQADVITPGTNVSQSWADPVAKTRQEIDNEADAKKENTLDSYDELSDSISLRNENRLLALEGKPRVTEAEFRAIKKAML